jgi:2',3'-cyclic-nucleotide 2'-phosphodiesterase/3'-nucleotidase
MEPIKIYATTDVHGAFDTAQMTLHPVFATLAQLHAEDPHAILIDNGDFFVGSPLTTYYNTHGEASPLVQLANQVPYDVMIPGNHDFDYGIERLLTWAEAFHGAYLCANLTNLAGEPLFDSFTIITRGGVRVAVLGVVTKALPQICSYTNTRDFIVRNVVDTLTELVPLVRTQADYVVVAYHGGIERDMHTGHETQYDTGEDEAYRILNTVAGIDALICGHQHRADAGSFRETNSLYVQPGGFGSHIGELVLSPDRSARSARLLRPCTPSAVQPEGRTGNTAKPTDQAAHPTIDRSAATHSLAANTPIPDRDGYLHWLDAQVDLTLLSHYIRQEFGMEYYYFAFDGDTVGLLRQSFPVPYAAQIYHVSRGELTDFLRLQSEDPMRKPVVMAHLPDDNSHETDIRILTNLTTLPAYRMERSFVTNIFDEYLRFRMEH